MTGLDWEAYARQSYGLQWANGERTKRATNRHSPAIRALMRPGAVNTSWPGWQAANIRSWW